MKKAEIYCNREKQKLKLLDKLKKSNISEADKKLILEFVKYKVEEDRIGDVRENKYIMHLRILGENLQTSFKKANKDDIKHLLNKLFTMDIKRGETIKKLSEPSKADYVIILKTFYKWLKGKEKPEETAWINPISMKKKRLSQDEILRWKDIIALSQSGMNPRDKAFPQVLYECGGRITEILSLKLNSVEYVQNGDALILHLRESKTEVRAIAIVKSAPALINWIENHPTRANKDSWLWIKVTKPDKIMNYSTARKVLLDLKRRSKVDCPICKGKDEENKCENCGGTGKIPFFKPVNPHNFRKSSASYFSHSGLTEFERQGRMCGNYYIKSK